MQSSDYPRHVNVTFPGIRHPLSPGLPMKIKPGKDTGRVKVKDHVCDKEQMLYKDLIQNRLHTVVNKGGAFLCHEFSATVASWPPKSHYTLSSGDESDFAPMQLTMMNRRFNGIDIIDLQEENPGNQCLHTVWHTESDDDAHSAESSKALSWPPNLMLVKHHQVYMPKELATECQHSYMERILNALYMIHCNKNRLFVNSLSYVELLNAMFPPSEGKYATESTIQPLLQEAFNRPRPPEEALFYPYDSPDYGSDYVVFPRSQTLKLPPEFLIHYPNVIAQIKATLMLQHQIMIFICNALKSLVENDSVPSGILLDLQLFEEEILLNTSLNDIKTPVNRGALIGMAEKIVQKLSDKRIKFDHQCDKLLRRRSDILFNHIKIVMQRKTHFVKEIVRYSILERQYIKRKNKFLLHQGPDFSEFEQRCNDIIQSPDSTVRDLLSLIGRAKKQQPKNTVISAIFEQMESLFQKLASLLDLEIKDFVRDDISQYMSIAKQFSFISTFYLNLCFLNVIVQIPRWILHATSKLSQEERDSYHVAQDKQETIHSILMDVVCSHNFGFKDFFERLIACFRLGNNPSLLFLLIEYMADYLSATSGVKLMQRIMGQCAELPYNHMAEINDADNNRLAINTFFLVKQVDPDISTIYKSVATKINKNVDKKSWPLIWLLLDGLLTSGRYDALDIKDSDDPIFIFFQTSIDEYRRDQSNENEDKQKIDSVQSWAKSIVTASGHEDVPYLFKMAVMQYILMPYYHQQELGPDGITVLAISYCKQEPKNIYMACRMLGDLFDLFDLPDHNTVVNIIDYLDSMECDGFFSPVHVLRKINEQMTVNVNQIRKDVVSRKLLSYLQQEVFSSIGLRSPLNWLVTGGVSSELMSEYNPNIFSLRRISRNDGLKTVAFPFFAALLTAQPDVNQLYLRVRNMASEKTLSLLDQEFSISANVWCLYAVVIAYLVSDRKPLGGDNIAIIATIYPEQSDLCASWYEFLEGRDSDNVALCCRALVGLEQAYVNLEQTCGVSPAGRQAVIVLMQSIVSPSLSAYYKEYICLFSMLNRVCQREAEQLISFLVKQQDRQIPFMMKNQHVGCLVVRKSALLSMFGEFNTWCYTLKRYGICEHYSLLIVLMTIEAESKIDTFDIIGSTVLDLFDFAWYLRCEQQQVALATAMMQQQPLSSNQTPKFSYFFETIGRERSTPNERECLAENIAKRPERLFSQSLDHIKLAFIVYDYFIGLEDLPCVYFIDKTSEALVALFFVAKILGIARNDLNISSLMRKFLPYNHGLTLQAPYDVLPEQDIFLEIRQCMEVVLTKNTEDKLSFLVHDLSSQQTQESATVWEEHKGEITNSF